MAIKVKFTDSFVAKLELLPAGGREVYQDTIQPNLCLRLTSTSKKLFLSFRFQYKQFERNLDEQRNVFQARLEVEQRKVEIRTGNERLAATKARLAAEKLEAERQAADAARAETRGLTIQNAVTLYLEKNPQLAKRTVDDYVSLRDNELSPYKNTLLDDVTRDKAIEMLYQIAERIRSGKNPNGKGARATYAMRLVRACCNQLGLGCQNWGLINGRPFPWIKSNPRRTMLEAELGHGRIIWDALAGKDTGGAALIKALMLTGCRSGTGSEKGEMIKLTVRQVDLSANLMVFYNTKNKTDHYVHITPQLREVIEPLLVGKKPEDKVFPINSDPKKLRAWLKKETGLTFSLHDFRRYFGDSCRLLGIPYLVKEACINHAQPELSKSYDNITPSAMRDAWQRHADSICPRNAEVINLADHRKTA
jgi:hypothetical protein